MFGRWLTRFMEGSGVVRCHQGVNKFERFTFIKKTMKEKERNMENWRMGCVNILPLTWRFPLGDIVNTTFMGSSHTRKYHSVLLCENESHTLEGLGM